MLTAGKVSTQLGDLIPIVAQPEGTKGQVAIRPENLYLQPDPKGLAVVTGRQFFGHDALVEEMPPKLTARLWPCLMGSEYQDRPELSKLVFSSFND